MRRVLVLRADGAIIEEIRHPGIVGSRVARDLRYRVEWFSNKGWVLFDRELTDDAEARASLREQRKRNKSIRWRIVAYNERAGSIALSHKWEGSHG